MKKITIVALLVTSLAACGPGEMGPPGTEGQPGSGLIAQRLCFAQFTLGVANILATHYQYTFVDGSTLVSCGLDASNGPGVEERSAPLFYKAADANGATGYCFINHTVSTSDGKGGGAFYFNVPRSGFQGTLTYKNFGGQFDNTNISLACSHSAG